MSRVETPTDWRVLIVQLVAIKEALKDVDRLGLWPFHLPRIAATDDEIVRVERRLAEPLDPGYGAFLRHAGGWRAFLQSVDLFGPHELLGSRLDQANEQLHDIEDVVFEQGGLTKETLLPIAASPTELDLFVLTRKGDAQPGRVIWFAGSEVDRFPTFYEFFMAMMDYNRLLIDKMRG